MLSGMWDCEAYGPEGVKVGALCFFGSDGQRRCDSPETCSVEMAGERQRIFSYIQEKAAAGHPDFVYLAGEFSSPDQLLNAGE
jgi:hypothetical protein